MSEVLDYIEMKLPAKAEYVGVVRLTISGLASRLGYSYDAIEDLKIAVAEAATNVVEHAYKDTVGLMGIGCRVFRDKMEIIVSDSGQSFNFEDLQKDIGPVNPNKPVQDLKEGGLGLFLIESLTDKVEIKQKSGVVIKMTKFLERDEVEQHVDGIRSTNAQHQ